MKLAMPLYLLIVLAWVLSGCATYQSKVQEARNLLSQDKPADAAKLLQPLAEKQNDDQLVYMLDYATALQDAANYKESAKIFGQAEKIADIQDYHSVSRIAGSLLLSQELVQYKGDNFEKVLINGMNSVNYLMMNELDDALVEVRRLNEKLHKFKYEGKKNYEQNPYAFYLSAVIWEAGKKWDDAYIDYKNTYDLVPTYPPLHEDLVRSAIRAQRPDDVKTWLAKFPEVKVKPEWKDPTVGELVFIYQQGWGPRKYPRPGATTFPKLFPVTSSTQRAEVEVVDDKSTSTQRIFNVQDVAIKTLDDDFAALVAMRVAGVATKAVVADQVRQKNGLLGDLTFLALSAADRADLRQWSTLPQSFQVARVYLKGGNHKVRVHGLGYGETRTGEDMPETEINIRPGEKSFLFWRSTR
jgi:hypothetical protein